MSSHSEQKSVVCDMTSEFCTVLFSGLDLSVSSAIVTVKMSSNKNSVTTTDVSGMTLSI